MGGASFDAPPVYLPGFCPQSKNLEDKHRRTSLSQANRRIMGQKRRLIGAPNFATLLRRD
jgi:hypothetical protein